MNKSEFVKLLELVQPALADSDVQIFSHFMLGAGTITASDDAMTIIAKSELISIDPPFAVKGTTLLGLLRNSAAETMAVKQGKDNDVIIKAGKSTFTLPFLPADDFLFEEPKKEKWDATVKIDQGLIQGLEACLTTVGRDYSAPAIMGVCFNFSKNLILYSCDGDAITKYWPEKLEYQGKGAFTVQNNFCEAILKISKETETTNGELFLNSNWIKATLGAFTLYGRLIENDNPLDHADLIEKTMTGKLAFVPLPNGFNEALSRARVVADSESKPTLLTVKGDKLSMLTESGAGLVADELDIEGHPPVEASVHASLIQKAMVGCEQLSIQKNCSCYRSGKVTLRIVSNIGE